MRKYREAVLYILFMILIIVFAVWQIKPKVVGIVHVERDLKAKTVELEDLDRKLETLRLVAKAKDAQSAKQIKKIYKADEAGLDTESSFAIPFEDVVEMAKYNAIKIYSMEYVYNPESDEFVKGGAGAYNVCQLNMQVIADYVDLESFLKDLYKYPYLITFDKIELIPYQRNKKILLTNLQLKLYSQK